MPEVVIQDEYAKAVPSFIVGTLPKEFSSTGEPVKEAPPAVAPAIPETPKPEAEAASTPPETEEQKNTDPEQGKETTGKDPEKSSSRRFERRIDRATRKAAEAEAKAEAAERRAAELEARLNAPKTTEDAPKMENFTDVAEYEKAARAHERQLAKKEFEKEQRESSLKTEQEELNRGWEDQVSKGVEKYDDFEDVVGDLKPDTAWKEAIMRADNGYDIAQFLGKHPKEAARINALRSPAAQVLEIGKLSVKLSQAPEAPKKPSQAPKPIAPVTGAAEATGKSFADPMPIEEYMKVGTKMFRGR